MVGDYAFPRNMGDDDTLTVLVLRVYPIRNVVVLLGSEQRA